MLVPRRSPSPFWRSHRLGVPVSLCICRLLLPCFPVLLCSRPCLLARLLVVQRRRQCLLGMSRGAGVSTGPFLRRYSGYGLAIYTTSELSCQIIAVHGHNSSVCSMVSASFWHMGQSGSG
ncbi:uncharacterized protein LOC120291202 [Eucalyptus grandis]|uniref:uncharacterized protein LOC120291202 n=1 Tax=Eucalyptus grandis TaxID=71139 RepID=UPI00192ED9FE|nr:uncharacterized protein LOC120291202 [Eucalyptus grandis]